MKMGFLSLNLSPLYFLTPLLTLLLIWPQQANCWLSPEQKEIRKYRPDRLPYGLSEKVRRFMDLHDVRRARLSPDGSKLFYNWNVTGTSQIWVLRGPKSFPLQLTSGESKTQLEAVSPDGKYIYFTRDDNGEDFDALYQMEVKNRRIKTLFHKKKVKATFGGLSSDGKRLYFLANDQDPEYFSVYRYGLEEGKVELIHHSQDHWKFFGELTNDKIYLYQTRGVRERELYLYDMVTKKLDIALGKKQFPKLGFFVVRPYVDGKLIVRSHHESDFYRLYLWDGEKMKLLSNADEPGDVLSFLLDPVNKTLFYEVNRQGQTRIEAVDVETMKRWDTSLLSKLGKHIPTQLSVESISDNGKFIALRAQGPRFPDQLYVWDREASKVIPWTIVSTPELDLAQFTEPTLEFFKAEDGTSIPMFVRRSERCREHLCPVVVHYHGGPEGESRPIFRPLGELFVQQDMIFVEPNVRGSRGYGRKFLEADDGRKRETVITDIRDCARHIKKNWAINGEEPLVGVTGRSYGGYLTLYAMTKFPGEYDAGVAIVGMSSLVTLLENTAPYRRQRRESEYGSLSEDREFLESLSPINFTENLAGPLLVIHGANDKKVPVTEALQLKTKLKDHAFEPDLIIFPDEGHKTYRRENRVLEYGHLLKFFKEKLKKKPPVLERALSTQDETAKPAPVAPAS